MRSMGDPNYVYRPMSEEQRQKMRDASRRVRGIPKGYHELYGVLVPNRHFEAVRELAAFVRGKTDDLEVVRTLIRTLVRQAPLLQLSHRQRLHQALTILAIRELSRAQKAERRARQRDSE